jgi:hypothetical protein
MKQQSDGDGLVLPRLASIPDAAQALGISPQSLYTRIRQGVLPPGVVVRFGRTVRIDPAALRDFIRRGGQDHRSRGGRVQQ